VGVSVFLILLLLHKPAGYTKPSVSDSNKVGKYVTHVLSPQFYNGLQRREPFELVIPQDKTKEIVDLTKWPKESGGTTLSAPYVFFAPECIRLMGTAAAGGVEFVVTVVVRPAIDEQGLLNLHVAKVKIGAMNITPLVRPIARRMYRQRQEATNVEPEDMGAKITASLLNDEPFEPVLKVQDGQVRIERITIAEKKLIIRLVPTPPAG